jgi:hypothetical protein
MTHQPLVERREAQPYAGIHRTAGDEAAFRAAADAGFPELFRWLGERGIEPTGPPFIRYLVVDGEGQPREFELGAPVTEPTESASGVTAAELPAGLYVTVLHVGPYSHDTVADLGDARAALLEWANREGIALDRWELERGTAFRGCVESYLTGAVEEADWSKWRTEIAYLTA